MFSYYFLYILQQCFADIVINTFPTLRYLLIRWVTYYLINTFDQYHLIKHLMITPVNINTYSITYVYVNIFVWFILINIWHDMVHRGQSRHFTEWSYCYSHLALNFRICFWSKPFSYLFQLQINEFLCWLFHVFLCFLLHILAFSHFGVQKSLVPFKWFKLCKLQRDKSRMWK